MKERFQPPPFSICIIVRNEAEAIGHCIEALHPLQTEIIIADTGSTDDTVRIAKDAGANVYSFEWPDDFSVARNRVAEFASNDLILAVDADEILTECDRNAFAVLIQEHAGQVGMISRISPTVRNGEKQSYHERIARLYDRTLFHYTGSIHENISSIDAGRTIQYYDLPLTFLHTGYESREKLTEKAKRDLKMLSDAVSQKGDDPYLFYQIGKCHVALQDHKSAVACFVNGLSMKPEESAVYVREMTESYGYSLLETGQVEKALAYLLSVESMYSYHADFCLLLGLAYMNCARFEDAADSFFRATNCTSYSVEGTSSYRAFYNIGVIFEVLGDAKEAASWYKRCGSFAPAQERLQNVSVSSATNP